MERTFVPKNRIKINIALAYLLSGTQGVEPRQLKDQIGVYHVLCYAAGYTVTFPYRGVLYLLVNMMLLAKRIFISLQLYYSIALVLFQMCIPVTLIGDDKFSLIPFPELLSLYP